MKLKTLVLFALAVCLSALSCIKEKKIVYVPVDADLQAHYNFKPGSYWIYRDSATAVEDSFVVIEYHLDTIQVQQDKNNYYYNIRTHAFIGQFHNNFMIDTVKWGMGLEAAALYFGYNLNDVLEIDMRAATFIDTTFHGIQYQNIRKYKNGVFTLYLKDNIGFVRFNFVYNTWELIRYNTVQ